MSYLNLSTEFVVVPESEIDDADELVILNISSILSTILQGHMSVKCINITKKPIIIPDAINIVSMFFIPIFKVILFNF